MASLLARLFARLTQKKTTQRRTRSSRNRALRLEPMEMRRLLAGDIGAVAGNLYVDLTDNGFDAGDAAVAGATVYLYRDGGNGTFNSGGGVAGGDDSFIDSIAADVNGNYRFDGLIAGTYFVEQAPAAGFLQRPAESPKTVVITEAQASGVLTLNVDTYDSTSQVVTAAQGTTQSSSIATAGGEALGGERDILVSNTGLPGSGDLEANTTSGVLNINADPGAQGSVIVTYDGADGDAATIDHTNLNLDLTASDATSFHFLATSQPGNTLTVNVYSGATNFSSVTVPLPVTGSLLTFENLIVDFADFAPASGSGANFAAVTAIRMEVAVAETQDARIDFSRVVAPFVSEQNFQNLIPMSIGDLVFNDANNNALFDAGETGIAGVTLELYQDSNLNGIFDLGTDLLIDTTTTDVGGLYLFDNLLPGEYFVLIPISEFATPADPLFGFASSSVTTPAPDPDDNPANNDNNGTLLAGVGVITAAITLASGTEPTNDGDTDPNSNLSIDFGFVPQIDLQVVKTVDAATHIAGNEVTYTITVSNEGDTTVNNVLVVDDLPDFMTVVTAISNAGGVVTQTGNAAGEIQVTYASLTPGQTATISIVALIPAGQPAAAVVTNSATVSGDGFETDSTNNTDTADIAITREAVLAITKTDSPDPNSVGSALTYEILVTNNGPSTATNVVVLDSLPAGLTFDNVITTAGTASQAAGVITVNIPTLAVGASAAVTVATTIQAGFAGSTISNSATADADEAELVSSTTTTTVNPRVDLQITKTDSIDPVSRGGVLTYTLEVTNNGPSGATNVEIVDTLPAGVTFVSATGGTVTPPAGGSSDVTIAIGSLASGGTATATITVNVLQTAATSISNTAIVRSTESLAGFDSDVTNNTATETTATQGIIDLAITKTDAADPVAPGEALVYTIIVTNNGPSDATGVNVVDNLPDGIRITSANSTVGTVTIPASAQDTIAANNDDLTVAIGNLAVGASATITVNAVVLPDFRAAGGTITNTAIVSSSTPGLTDSNTANNTASETTTLTPEIDLRVTKTDSPDPAIAGNSLTYQIIVTNDGPSTATNVSISDTLPAGVTFTNVITTQGTATNNNGVVTGALGTLAPGAAATVTITVGINPATRGSLTNTVTASAAETDTNTTNNTASTTTTINGSIDLAITKTDSADPIGAGAPLVYTILVTNNGPSTATNVVVTDNLSTTGVTFVSGSSTVGTVANAAGLVTANVGTLAPGASATITLNTTVPANRTTDLSNTATVTATETDTNTANNTAVQTTAIAVPGSLSGSVYIDTNENGVRDAGEPGIAGVTIALAGTDVAGTAVNRTATTDASGDYTFANLLPGTYTLTQTQPAGFVDGQANPGTGATTAGTAGPNTISNIVLGNSPLAVAFNFGEVEVPEVFSKRLFLASSGS